jgi:hypothetical protein
LQELVDTANNVRDNRLRGVEYATLDLELLVVGVEEVLVKMDDRVLTGLFVAEVTEDGRQVGLLAA